MRPGRHTCRGCSHPVVRAQTEDGGAVIVLEVHESASGPGRFAIWDDGYAHPVSAGRSVLAHEIHNCPADIPRSKRL